MTVPPLGLREVRPADAEDLRAIYNDAVLHTTAVFDYVERSRDGQLAWLRAKAEAGLPVLVAEEAGAVIGYASYGPFRPWPAYLHTVENALYIAPAARGRGVGAALLGALLEVATARGLHTVIAGITADNAPSLRLHERLGYQRVGVVRECGWKFERWLDLVFLQKLLRSGPPG